MKSSKGYSLIELVVVIAIMVVLTAGISISISSVTKQKEVAAVKRCGDVMGNAETRAMARGNGYFILTKDDDGNYYVTDNADSLKAGFAFDERNATFDEALGDMTISVENSAGVDYEVSKDTPLVLGFNKSTGSFKPMQKYDAESDKMKGLTAGGSDLYAKAIVFTKGSFTKKITLYPKTGKYKIED